MPRYTTSQTYTEGNTQVVTLASTRGDGKALVPASEPAIPEVPAEDEDLEIKLRRITEQVPVRISNTSGSSAGSGSGDFHQSIDISACAVPADETQGAGSPGADGGGLSEEEGADGVCDSSRSPAQRGRGANGQEEGKEAKEERKEEAKEGQGGERARRGGGGQGERRKRWRIQLRLRGRVVRSMPRCLILAQWGILAPPPRLGLFLRRAYYNRLTVAEVRELIGRILEYVRTLNLREVRVNEPIAWAVTLTGNVVVRVQLLVMNQIWGEDRGGICSMPSSSNVYPFGDMVNAVREMGESIFYELLDRERWYGAVEIVLRAFGITYEVQRDELLALGAGYGIMRECNVY
ncbi:hypothetical protein SELMODRAFT_432307 [Selaginella moellendorffii]|uniref:Uncharacterized protein n=1 Tax=Selaginella moellendorffii TaxID=88036 RepID=D8TFL3_SELML|nr:hypothetical protein SELMODRAFT_432307 [Selaginella moellendorffii]